MIVFTFILAVCLSLASGRDSRFSKFPSGVSHSILNLGRMNFNIYINPKPSESPKVEYEMVHPFKPYPALKVEPEGCPCEQNSARSRDLGHHGPPDMLSKILLNNDLFSFKGSASSSQCCSSQEQTQEEFYLEFSPNKKSANIPLLRQGPPAFPPHFPLPPMPHVIPPLSPMPMPVNQLFPKSIEFLPLFLDTLHANKSPQKSKSKMVEIFLFPTRKPVTKPAPTKPTADIDLDIQIVGNKQTTMLYDLISNNPSVKKDLTQDVGTGKKDIESALLTQPSVAFNQNNTL